ncbi:MAG: hypothetical protein CL424_17695 [Acidimicrobiaceae bacterium]|nr:hypothetical protein [Acidimicrobiaceae bacterium]
MAVFAAALPTEMSAFALASDGDAALVITVDGDVHRIDVDAGSIVASNAIVEAFELPDGHGGPPVPRIAVVDGHIFVIDPATGSVIELDERLDERARFEVGGAPAGVVLVG